MVIQYAVFYFSEFVNKTQEHIKKMVENKYFQRGILFAILINTLSMGIEYHNQVRNGSLINFSQW